MAGMQYSGATEGAQMIPIDNAKFGSDRSGIILRGVEAMDGESEENVGLTLLTFWQDG